MSRTFTTNAAYLLVTSLSLCAFIATSFCAFGSDRAEGPGSGGGGGSIICVNPDQTLKSAELVDLVESVFYEKTVLSANLSERPWQEQVDLATARIAFADPQFHSMLLERLQNVRGMWDKALQETAGTDLVFPAPQDLSHGRLPPIHIGCQVAGAAVYNDTLGTPTPLIVSSLIWNALPEIHKAALVLHEAIYRTHRDITRNVGITDAPDSSATRALVGFLLSRELEDNSLTLQERERFAKNEIFRGYEIDAPVDANVDPFRARVRSLIHPLLPYVLKGVERPLFLSTNVFRNEEITVKIDDKDYGLRKAKCELRAVAFVWPGKTKVTMPAPVVANKAKGHFEFKFHLDGSDNALEDLRLNCATEGLHRYNPGFQVYIRGELAAEVRSSERYELTGLSVRNKSTVERSLLKNIP